MTSVTDIGEPDLATCVRDARVARHWSQATLALAAGINEKTVRRLEAGATVSAETVLAVCATLEIPSDVARHSPARDQPHAPDDASDEPPAAHAPDGMSGNGQGEHAVATGEVGRPTYMVATELARACEASFFHVAFGLAFISVGMLGFGSNHRPGADLSFQGAYAFTAAIVVGILMVGIFLGRLRAALDLPRIRRAILGVERESGPDTACGTS